MRSAQATFPEFFISVDGSDSWDGSNENHQDNTNIGPWKTLNHAIDELRGDIYMTSANFLDFFCSFPFLMYRTHALPRLFCLLLGGPPPSNNCGRHMCVCSLRQIRPNPPAADSHATLVLLPGTHYVTSKIAMNQRDSHIVIKSLNDEEASISGRGIV